MREHQIVITLKPEQFQEVQRLSQEAGAKSMGIFVRQALLAALGISGSKSKPIGQAESIKDLGPKEFKKLSAELSKLHSELKTFVTESLAGNLAMESAANGVDAEAAVDSVVVVEQENSIIVNMEPTTNNPAFGSKNKPSSYYQGRTSNAFQDPLEQYAKRAFSASPRLGQIPPSALPAKTAENNKTADSKSTTGKQNRDPLDDLLEDSDLLPEDASNETVAEQNTESPKELLVEEPLVSEQTKPITLDNEEKIEEQNKTTAQNQNAPTVEFEDEQSAKTPIESDSSNNPPSNSKPPSSGGPPPRKRQT